MKEITFLKRNSEKWRNYEQFLQAREGKDPDQLAELYVELTDDLAYARTFYPTGNTVGYLNDLAAKVHQEIYQNKRERKKRVFGFWTTELPLVFAKYQTELLVAFIVFALSTAIGALSQANNFNFVTLILGERYVEETIHNIQSGHPFGVYSGGDRLVSFLGIAVNNIRVSFFAFVAGVIFSVGSGFILLGNGIMFGAFLYFFGFYNVFDEAIFTVMLHGTIEIWAIVVGGCAGFVLGNGFLFPGSYSRGASFLRAAQDGSKIIVGLIPFFLVAAFIEGFITGNEDMSAVSRYIIVFGSLAGIIWYFIIYPNVLLRRTNDQPYSNVYLVASASMIGFAGLLNVIALAYGFWNETILTLSIFFGAFAVVCILFGLVSKPNVVPLKPKQF
jgi:uncharacterized membrane protein SpoIIM required for sporulation